MKDFGTSPLACLPFKSMDEFKTVKRDYEVEHRNFLFGMTDLHSHVLFGVDDGPRDLEGSIRLCKMYIENGYSAAVATPHYIRGTDYQTSTELVEKRKGELESALKERGMEFSIYTGMEVRLEEGIIEGLADKRIFSLNDSRYVLVELPLSEVPSYTFDLVFRLQSEGYIPVLAHPERNSGVSEDISLVQRLFEQGIIMQVNKGSILGEYGESTRKIAVEMLSKGLVHVISTDSHRPKDRNPSLGNIDDILCGLVGSENIVLLLKKNPDAIINDADVAPMITNTINPVTRRRHWPIVIISLLLLGALTVWIANYAFDKSVDYAFEKLMSGEVLKDPELAKQIRRLNGKNYGIINTTGNEGTDAKPVTQSGLSEVGLDGRPINGGVVARDGSMQDYIDSAMYEDSVGNQSLKKSVDAGVATNSQNEVNNTNETEKFTSADRERVTSIVYSAVPAAEIKRLKGLASGDLTDAKIAEIKSSVKGYLSDSQIAELKKLYVKYENSK